MWGDKPTQTEWEYMIDILEWYINYLKEHEPSAYRTIDIMEETIESLPFTVDEIFEEDSK